MRYDKRIIFAGYKVTLVRGVPPVNYVALDLAGNTMPYLPDALLQQGWLPPRSTIWTKPLECIAVGQLETEVQTALSSLYNSRLRIESIENAKKDELAGIIHPVEGDGEESHLQ